MKSCRKELWFDFPTRRAFVNITPQVVTCLAESGVREAWRSLTRCTSPRRYSFEQWLEFLAPDEPTSQYFHNRTGVGNADGQLKRQVMGHEVVAITKGKLDFGPRLPSTRRARLNQPV